MNKSGCKDPVAETAIHNEQIRETLRKKYSIKEGDTVRMKFRVRTAFEGTEEKLVKVRIKEIHPHIITVILPSGMTESFSWWEFAKKRR